MLIRRGNGGLPSTERPIVTSSSPESAPSTFAWAASSTDPMDTDSSFASRRNAVASSSGILVSCSPSPGRGSRVHRGTAVDPAAGITLHQNARAHAALVTVSCRLILLISHFPGGVSTPPRAGRDTLSLHEEGVGGEHGAITHRHTVEDERANSNRAAGAKRTWAGLVGAVL